MDSIISSALEEISSGGQVGISLSSLCTKIDIPPPLKPSLWRNLLSIPVLRFKAPNAEFLCPTDASIQCAEGAEKLGIMILAHETLRNNFVGLYDENVQISFQQRRTLERLAIARTNGVTQSQLAEEFGIEGRNFFYILKNLECRGLILKQPAVVRKKEHCSEGESKNSSPVATNLIYLHRYAKRLGSQQRFEINKEQTFASLGYDDENVADGNGRALENAKDTVLVNDYLPAMKAVCDKLEEANGKVLVVSDIKRDLGYTRSSGHRAWRNIYRRLKDAGLIEKLHAVVNEKAEICLRLVKTFPEKSLEPKLLGCYDPLDKVQQLKFGRSILNVDQIVELPIDNQIYDMVDAEGSEGLPVMTVCERLGIDKKRSYSRFFNMFSRFGMHLQAESHKKTTAYRVWTSGNSYCKSSNAFLIKSKNSDDEKQIPNLDCGHSEVPDESNHNLIDYNPSTSAGGSFSHVKGNDIENDTEISCGSLGETNQIVLYSDNAQSLPSEQSNTAQDAELDLIRIESQICASPQQPIGHDMLTPADSGSYQTFSSQVLTADGARREQRVLGRLQDEKFILRPELYRWLVEHEKDKSTKLDRKTVDRMLKKLQQQGHCKCMHINVPVVTNCGRSRITQVVLHPSVKTLHLELLSEIHDRLRSFEMQIRGHGTSKLKSNDSIPVLDGVQRTHGNVDSDDKSAKAETMRANGFVLAKMVRSKLLHQFLWGFLSSFHGWDNDLALEKHMRDQKNLHGSCILFSLEAAIKAIPLELFLQVVGTTLKFDDMIEKCKKGFCLSDLRIEEYKLLMNTQATGRLSLLVDILRRLKLIRLVPDECSDNRLKVPHANLTHAMELKPYIEEPLSLVATSTSRSPDLRPRIRHDFILSNREAVDEYWKTLEYCYAAADPRAALLAFPGSAVHKVFLSRSWASDRVMTADQRAELLKRILKDNLHEKLSYRDCEKIAKDLNLTLQQVLRVYYDKQQKRLNRFRGVPNSNEEQYLRERKKRPSDRKRKRHSTVKSIESSKSDARPIQLDEKEAAALPGGIDGLKEDYSLASSVGPDVFQAYQEADAVEAVNKPGSLEEDEECYSLNSQNSFSKMKPTRNKRISWTDNADRELVTQYARYRAAMGAKFHRVDWTSLAGLPASPHACARRMASLNRSANFRKALMKLCNMLSERYMIFLKTSQNRSSNSSDCRLLRFSSIQFSNGIEQSEYTGIEEERWDDFNDIKIKSVLDDVLRFKQIAKLEASTRVGSVSAEWSSVNMNSEDRPESELVLATTQDDDIEMPGAGRRKGSIQSSEHHRFHQKLVKLWNVGNGVGRQVHESLAVSNAVELFKLVFLSISTAPQFPNLLSETLHRYSEHDLFAAFSYLRDRKIMIGGTCGQPFVLSQQFLHSISKSLFPCNTSKRAANFSAWIREREEDLMEGGINLTADLQCGDIFHLFSLVFSGELSLSPCLPDEGVGEAEDLRSLKRRAEDNELCGADKAKKLKSIAEGEFVSRREKGFPGIRVSMYRTTFPTTTALELFKDEETFNSELLNDKSSTSVDHMKEMLESSNNVTIASKSSESPWEAMASYTEHLLSNPSDEGQGGHLDPEIIKAVCTEIQKAGDQGLSIEEVNSLVKMPGEKTCEIIIDMLQAFGRAIKVNAYDSVRVVDALYHSKYSLATISCFHQDLKPPLSLTSLEKDGDNLVLQQEDWSLDSAMLLGSMTVGDVHKVTILNLPEEHALPSNEIPTSNANESCMYGKVGLLKGDDGGIIYQPFTGQRLVPILPWVNADGTINKSVYSGLVRRVLGTVMQSPGILEEDIICRMDVLNPQSCRKLLELMILDRHLIVRKMLQTTGSGPPAILATLIGSGCRKSRLACRRHFFANPTSTSFL